MMSYFTFSLYVDPLKYERDDLLGVDVSVPGDVLDGLQGETCRVFSDRWQFKWNKLMSLSIM